MSDIIDNRRTKLADVAAQAFALSESSDIATGYFFLPGLAPFAEVLPRLKEIRLLMGQVTDQKTIDFLAHAIPDDEQRVRFHTRAEMAGVDTRRNRRYGVVEELEKVVARLVPSKENEEFLKDLATLLEPSSDGHSPRLKARVFTKGKLHAKCYLFDFHEKGRQQNLGEPGIGIVGSSNLTLSGLTSNTELNVKVRGEANYRQLKQWFEKLWSEAEEFSPELMTILKESWAIADHSHFDVWYNVLKDYVGDLEETDEWRIIREVDFPEVTKFQQEAVERANRVLDKYDGVFISDVVGLGKTYIGAFLLKRLTLKPGYQAGCLVVCPAQLVEMWADVLERFGIPGSVLSMGKLSVEEGILRRRYLRRKVVLIDESHNFRNSDTNRYQELVSFTNIPGKKVILLTATPMSKGSRDIKNQLRLFHPEDPTEIPIHPNHIKRFFECVKRREQRLLAIRESGREPTDKELEVLPNEARLRDILWHILIRRTRRHIEEHYDERTEEELKRCSIVGKSHPDFVRPYFTLAGKRVTFPVRKLSNELYSIDEVYEGIFEDIISKLSRVKFARYSLGTYVLPDHQDKPKYEDLSRAGKALLPLIKTGLLKRFESSVYAFKCTIQRMVKAHEIFEKSINKGSVPLGEEVQRIIYGAEDWMDDEDIIDELLEKGIKYPAKDFDVKELIKDLQHDKILLKRIWSDIQTITPNLDDKLIVLKQILNNKIGKEKVIVFTEYRDTAVYLKENLQELPLLEQADSNTKNLLDIIRRFSPISNNYEIQSNSKEIKILIATDIFSEGLNLQDCSRIINYDLHWNPVRLIQRIGRVDRIGTLSDTIVVYNFLPETKLDEELGIRGVLEHRIQEIHDNLGEDEKILSDAERLNKEAMYAIYDQKDLDKIEAELQKHDVFDLTDIVAELHKFTKLRQLKNLPTEPKRGGIRGRNRKGASRQVAVFRCGDIVRFFASDEKQEPILVDEEIGLALMKPKLKDYFGGNDPQSWKGEFQKQGPVSDEHREFLVKCRKKMDDLRKERSSILSAVKGQSKGHRYVIEELHYFLRDGNPNKREREQTIKVIEVLKDLSSVSVMKRLRKLKAGDYKGKELLTFCIELINEQEEIAFKDLTEKKEELIDPITLVGSLEFGKK